MNKVEVRGSRITFKRQPVIIAAEIKKGDKILKLCPLCLKQKRTKI